MSISKAVRAEAVQEMEAKGYGLTTHFLIRDSLFHFQLIYTDFTVTSIASGELLAIPAVNASALPACHSNAISAKVPLKCFAVGVGRIHFIADANCKIFCGKIVQDIGFKLIE